jgi:predicted O-methyltransferase YrrM
VDQEVFSAVDEFVGATVAPEDEALRSAVAAAEEAGLPAIQVSPPQGKLLQLLVRLVRAKRVLEFGTLGGYSAILMGRALPEDGRLITLEAKAEYAEVARRSIDAAGVGEKVEIRVGPALEGAARARGRGAVRSRLHRRRQGQHAQLLRLGARAHPSRRPHRRRQRCPRRQPRQRRRSR